MSLHFLAVVVRCGRLYISAKELKQLIATIADRGTNKLIVAAGGLLCVIISVIVNAVMDGRDTVAE